MPDAGVPGGLEEHVAAEDVCLDERPGSLDRAVDVSLGGEVDDRVAAVERGANGIPVGDVGDHQLETVLGQ